MKSLLCFWGSRAGDTKQVQAGLKHQITSCNLEPFRTALGVPFIPPR